MNADNTPCANCQINFNPPNNRPQIVGGTSVNPQAAYTTTDSNGNLAAISLIQGTLMVVTIQNPATGGYSAGIAAAVPFNVGTTFTQLLAQNNLAPGTSTVNGLSVGTRTLTPSGTSCTGGTCTSLVTDFMLACDASSGNVVYNLPASSGGGRWLDFEKVDSTTNTCTLAAAGADTINGAATLVLSTQYSGVLVDDKQVGKWFAPVGVATFPPITGGGTDNLPCYNGSRCGEKNVGDFGAIGGNSWSLEATSCTSNGTSALSCSGLASTHFAKGQHVGFYAGATAPTAAPTPAQGVVFPLTLTSKAQSVGNANTYFASGCTVFNPGRATTAAANGIFVTNPNTFENGNILTIEGNNYTINNVNNGADFIGFTTNLLTAVTGRTFADGVLNGTATVTSATAVFVAGDVNRPITGIGIPATTLTSSVTLPAATLNVLSTAGFTNGAATIAVGTQTVSCTGTTANTFTTCTGGKGFVSLGNRVVPVVQSITNGTTIVMSESASASASAVSIRMDSEPVTGANCTTARSYEHSFIYSNGAMGPLSPAATSTVSANAQNFYNMNQYQGAWDANAIAAAIYSCEGASCSSFALAGIEIPSEVYNPQNQTSGLAWLNDTWMFTSIPSGTPKAVPTIFTFHDVGEPYGSDQNLGTSPPAATGQGGIITASITGISGTTVTLSATVPKTVTANMVHDDGPAINAAIADALNTSPVTGENYYTGVYAPAGQYPVVTQLSVPAGSGFHIYGDGGRASASGGAGDGSIGATRFVNFGPMGQVMLPILESSFPEVDHLDLSGAGGSTMGVGTDIDTLNSVHNGLIDSQGNIHDMTIECSNTGLRMANINTGNIEFFSIHDNWIGSCPHGTSGPKGVEVLSGNSLGHIFQSNNIFGQIGVFTVGGFTMLRNNTPIVGSVRLWLAPFLSTPITDDFSRSEHLTRWIYSPNLGGSFATQSVLAENNTLLDNQATPDCGYIVPAGGGAITLMQNTMESAQSNTMGDLADPSVCPNGIAHSDDNLSWIVNGNIWEHIVTPYANLGFGPLMTMSNGALGADLYQASTQVLTPVGISSGSATPTSLTINSNWPYTIPDTFNTAQMASVAIANAGAITSLPFATGTADIYGSISLNINGTVFCTFIMTLQHAGASGTTTMTSHLNLSGTPTNDCSTVKNTANTLNVYFDTGLVAIAFQNNTNINNQGMTVVTNTGPWGTVALPLAAGITSHTLTGATPVMVVASATSAGIDVENLVMSANVTSYTTPAAATMADGEIIHAFIHQPTSGGPWTLPSGTVGPFTAGSGTIIVANSAVTCPTIGTTQSATVPSELHASMVYQANLTELVVESCVGVR